MERIWFQNRLNVFQPLLQVLVSKIWIGSLNMVMDGCTTHVVQCIRQQQLDNGELVEDYHPDVFKPFIQPMHLDLSEDPNERPTPIRLGYRTGRKALIELLDIYKSIGVNHLFLALFDGQRPADEVLDELGEEVLPHFPAL